MNYAQVLSKIVVGAIVLVVYTRATGRSQITPMSATDVVSSIVIGSLISESMFEDTISVWGVLLVVVVWSALFLGIRELKTRRIRAERLLDGKAVYLVKDGVLQTESFGVVNMTLRDFETLFHQEGIASIDEMQDVLFEPNGKLTIVKKGDEPLSELLVENGQVYTEALDRLDKTAGWLQEELLRQGYSGPERVFCAEWHKDRLWVYPQRPKA